MPEPKSPVIVGCESLEHVFGANQPEYVPLPALRSPDGIVTSRWELTQEEREMIANGADVFVSVFTFNGPYPPTRVQILHKESDPAAALELLETV
jgi:hypothetical protein